MTHDSSLRVECYAGYRGEQTPRVLRFGEREVVVAEVLDSWLAPDHRYFKCKGSDGDIYIVRHDVLEGRWDLTMFARGCRPEDGRPDDMRVPRLARSSRGHWRS